MQCAKMKKLFFQFGVGMDTSMTNAFVFKYPAKGKKKVKKRTKGFLFYLSFVWAMQCAKMKN